MKRLVIASNNQGKIREIEQLLAPLHIQVETMKEALDKDIDIEETGSTFEENALIKAKAIYDILHCPVLADDSGLEIDYLNKEPGIYSARYLGHDTSYDYKNKKILERLENVPFEKRSARFVCAMALYRPGYEPIVIKKTFEGYIHDKIEGDNGFGYDPIFYYPKLKKTSSQMSSSEKNTYSHRGQALRELFDVLKEDKK